ncbi:uncharacterized protein [Melopsittacus undulatus]|uniref:uncharacterized protein n=1 Tax=Melopsittacus undulatus TaxID=13146 RepID=UPI001469B4D0|nr:uncharacterized protein LOC117437223 [Melopsittacus undulatus]
MDPAVPRATLKVLALCAALLVLVAAVTVAVAVMVWRSEALGKLRGCRERAANESRELGNAVAELEQERARMQRVQDALRRELAQAHGDSKKINGSLVSCREWAVGAAGNGDRRVLSHLHAWGIFSCSFSWERAWPQSCGHSPEEEPVPPPSGFIRLNNGPERLEKCSRFPGLAPGWALGSPVPSQGCHPWGPGSVCSSILPRLRQSHPHREEGFPHTLIPTPSTNTAPREHGDRLGTWGGGEKGQDTAHPCPQARLVANVTALGHEVLALQRERDELARGKAALEGELVRGEERALGLRQQLEQAMEQQRALRARRERCEARHRDLEAAL